MKHTIVLPVLLARPLDEQRPAVATPRSVERSLDRQSGGRHPESEWSGLRFRVLTVALVVLFAVPASESWADSLLAEFERCVALRDQSSYAEAEKLAEDLLERARAAEQQELVADLLELLVDVAYSTRVTTARDQQRAREAVQIREQMTPPDHAGIARAQVLLAASLGENLADRDGLIEAERHLRAALQIQRRLFGANSLVVADTLSLLAELMDDRGDSGETWGELEGDPVLAVAREAVEVARAASPTEGTRELAETLNTLGNLLERRGLYEAAREVYFECFTIRLRVFPPGHSQIARAYHNRGYIQRTLGEFEGARVDLEEALRLRRIIAGDRYSGVVASTLHELAQLDFQTGDVVGAVEGYERALAAMREGYGEDHWMTAEVHTDWGEALQELNDATALSHHQHALAILQRSDPDGARALRAKARLGALLVDLGELDRGRALLIEAEAKQERLTRPHFADWALTLRLLAEIAVSEGKLAEAERRLEQAVNALARVDARDQHADYVPALLELTEVHLLAGASVEAGDALERAKEALAASPVERLPLLARLMELESHRSRILPGGSQVSGAAMERALEAVEHESRTLMPLSRGLSPSRALRARHGRGSALDLALSLALEHDLGGSVSAVWQAVASRRGAVLAEQELRYSVARRSESPHVRDLFTQLTRARAQLARLQVRDRVVATANSESEGALAALLPRAVELVERLEGQLARALVEGAPVDGQRFRTDWLNLVPDGSLLLSYVRFRSIPAGDLAGIPHYGVFKLEPKGAIEFADLGPAAHIDSTIARYREAVSRHWYDPAASEELAQSLGTELRRCLLDPVQPIAPEESLFVVPEGSIHLLNLSALPSETPGRFLVEELPPLAVLTAERDLVPRPAPAQAARLLAVGGPDFDYRARQVARPSPAADEVPGWVARWKGLAESARYVAERFLRNPCRSDETLYFTPLKAARTEAEWVSSWMKEQDPSLETTTALGSEATEAWFKREAAGATSLHIASHGFFDLSCTADEGLSEVTELPRSGIAMAGANWSSEALPGADDGLLMANEIAGLDLSSVQEVVVSACESAVGSASEGEGIFGMTRAFRLAGVRNQIVSLWPVDDSATLVWMQRFYWARSAGASTVEAVRLASVETLRSADEDASSPAVWAGFVPVVRGIDR